MPEPNTKTDLGHYVFGKVQPQAVPLEEAVLGAIMLDKSAISIVLDILTPDSFYKDSHRLIYESFLVLFRKNQPIDLLTVTEELKKAGNLESVGGAYYLVELTNRVASAANIEYHARIILQKSIQRGLISECNHTLRAAYEDQEDALEILDSHEQRVFALAHNTLTRTAAHVGQIVSKSIKQIELSLEKPDGLTGVPSGFTEIDRITSGWQDSDLIIVAARPGMGKTSFVISTIRNAAIEFKRPVAMFSLEMSSVQIVNRLISMEAEIEGSKIRNAKLMEQYEWQQFHSASERISQAPIYIDDTPGINMFELRAKCRRLKMQYNIQLVVVDYLQLMGNIKDSKQKNREQEVSQISRDLKGLAKDLNVPVIALSQLSRAVETRGGTKKPQLSDLRDSGSIEQDADIVSFIYRPEYYQIEQDEEGQSLLGVAEIIIAKNRNGALKTVKLKFTDRFARFSDLDEPDFNELIGDHINGNQPNIITRSQIANGDDLPF